MRDFRNEFAAHAAAQALPRRAVVLATRNADRPPRTPRIGRRAHRGVRPDPVPGRG